MQRNQVEEFYRELDAPREDFVRMKYLTGGYGGWKIKHVKQWLDAKDSAADTLGKLVVQLRIGFPPSSKVI